MHTSGSSRLDPALIRMWVDYAGTALFGLILTTGIWRASRMRLEASDDAVTVFGYASTVHIPWVEITRFDVTRAGLIVFHPPSWTRCSILGKSNLHIWFGRRSRNDDVASELTEVLEAHVEGSPVGCVSTPG